ncbi:MAG: hypothetical protein ACLGPL_06670 [Acidobacteriota bacterium]
MLHGKGIRTASAIVMVLMLVIGTASFSLAATKTAQRTDAMCGGNTTGSGWGCGQGWTGGTGIGWCNGMWGGQYGNRGTQFMAHAKIKAIDTQASTITVTLDGASASLLTKLGLTRADLPADATLTMSSTVKVWGCGWQQNAWGSGSLTVADLKPGNNVNLMGFFDKTSGDPVVSKINVWFY